MAGNVLNKIVAGLMGGYAYGFPVARVESMTSVPEITPVPGLPSFVEGVMNLRGLILPVIDLPPENIEPLPAAIAARSSGRLSGIGKAGDRLILPVDLPKLLTAEEGGAVAGALDRK